MNKIVLEVFAKFDRKIRLRESKYDHVCKKHPEVVSEIEKMEETLVSPQIVRRSLYDEKVWLFYRFFENTP